MKGKNKNDSSHILVISPGVKHIGYFKDKIISHITLVFTWLCWKG